MKTFLLLLLLPFALSASPPPKVLVGADLILTDQYRSLLKGKRVGVITNQTAVNRNLQSTADALKGICTVTAFFAPEHGLNGASHAEESVVDQVDKEGVPVYSLHGKTKRPDDRTLQNVDLLIYDIQDIGSRSYTYITTLFYAMEEAAKRGIEVIVLDRPNPINGVTVDGPMMEEKWRSFVGYINIPYCHGMTVGELARYFNEEYRTGCKLRVIPMKGWKREMTFQDTGLPWIPTSPHIPEASTPLYYPATGILGELQIVNIGVGYTLPFKVVGAPWINGALFAEQLNKQGFPGVLFKPFHYKPFYGKCAKKDCEGVLIVVTDPKIFQPVATQYLLIGMLKGLYPKQFEQAVAEAKARKEMFCKVNGTEEVYRLIANEKNIVWPLKKLHQAERAAFIEKRKKYLLY